MRVGLYLVSADVLHVRAPEVELCTIQKRKATVYLAIKVSAKSDFCSLHVSWVCMFKTSTLLDGLLKSHASRYNVLVEGLTLTRGVSLKVVTFRTRKSDMYFGLLRPNMSRQGATDLRAYCLFRQPGAPCKQTETRIAIRVKLSITEAGLESHTSSCK